MKRKNNKLFFIIVPVLIALILAIVLFDRYQTNQFAKKYTTDVAQTNNNKKPSSKDLPTIYCVGDSFTIGQDNATSYPDYLKNKVSNDIKVIGDSSINTSALAIKFASQDIYVDDLTIPSNTNEVAITLLNENGEAQDALLNSKTGIENCSINNISGSISYNQTTNQLVFKRSEAGSSTMITNLTKVEVTKPELEQDRILILFTGSYEESVQGSLVNYQKQIINTFNTDKYLVISLTIDDRDSTNNLLANSYGSHYLDFKNYLLTDGLNDAKISATSDDQAMIANGNVPSSLLLDSNHGNNSYNQLLANKIYEKLTELGYLD